jgi:prevent-host-death family protein
MPTTAESKKATALRKLRARLLAKRASRSVQGQKTVVVTVTASKAREQLSTWVRFVNRGKWVVLERHGKPEVAIIPVADLEALREMEDAFDLRAAREAMNEPGEVPWEEVKARLGL